MAIPNLKDIKKARNLIHDKINKTPVITSSSIDKITDAKLHFKCENFQKVGAFKFRGACNSVFSLSNEEIKNGVCTHSSGNHAQALALAASTRGVPAFIVMPENSPKVKSDAVAGYGGRIIFCKPTLEARESTLEQVKSKTGAREIHPYDYKPTISGQGTCALEFLEEVPDLDIIITPVGGGGLLSGTMIATKETNPNIKVYAAEPQGADDAKKSFESGKLIPSVNPNTICDGLLTSLGEMNFEIIKKYLDDVLLVSDEEIISAMKLIYERMKIVVEPSSATVLATVLKYPEIFKNKNVGLILSGGNVDLDDFFAGFTK